jgi:nitrous oxide reductase accessory protein NosL
MAAAGQSVAKEKAAESGEMQIDPQPLDRELEKYPRCIQCSMDRRKYQRTRHLIHFEDGTAEGSCSLRCVAVMLMQNNHSRRAQAVYAADFGAEAEPPPLVNVDQATYVIGGDFPAVMTKLPTTAFASLEAAKAGQAAKGGEIATYEQALVALYAGLVDNMKARRMQSAERERRNKRREAVDAE